jgi:hypothetical protein
VLLKRSFGLETRETCLAGCRPDAVRALLTGCERKPLAFAAAIYLGSGRDSRALVQEIGEDGPRAMANKDYAWYGDLPQVIEVLPVGGRFRVADDSVERRL